METLKKFYNLRKNVIKKRLDEFSKRTDDERYEELCFCLLTPQSRARLCWDAIQELKKKNLLKEGAEQDILPLLNRVRFSKNKAKYIIAAREQWEDIKEKLQSADSTEIREWLVKNVKGYGYKEASHFMRNVGFSGLAILDRHILNNLVKYSVIDEIPKSLTTKKYLEIEEKMKTFASKAGVPMDELDLLFWSMQTGEVFK
jgi:N-glycosylase/DNA lyase